MDPKPRTFTREQLERELAIVEERERGKAQAEDAARGPEAAAVMRDGASY